MRFWRELSRRNIYRVGVTYVVVAYVIVQVVNELTAAVPSIPASLSTIVVVLLGVGLPITLIIAWAFELTPDGIKRTDPNAESATAPRLSRHWDFAIIGVLVAAVAYFALFDGSGNESGDTGIGGSPEAIADEGGLNRPEIVPTETVAPLFEANSESEEAKAGIIDLIDNGNWPAAYLAILTYEAAHPADPELADLWPLLSWVTTIESDPPGATVSLRHYEASDDGWVTLGVSPIEDVRVPFGLSVLRFELDGHRTVIGTIGGDTLSLKRIRPAPTNQINSRESTFVPFRVFQLDLDDPRLPPDMVRVPGWTNQTPDGEPVVFADFFLGQYEVTNAEYQAFIDFDGYTEEHRDLWVYPFIDDNGNELTFDEAMGRFEDENGNHVPSTWIGGQFPSDEEDYPVRGISFFEAAAFARWRGVDLPTVDHFARAVHQAELAWSIPASNFESDVVLPVGASRAINWNGNHDLSGNVREWVVNRMGDGHVTVGGGFSDPVYAGLPRFVESQSPWDREAFNGLRLAHFPYDEQTSLAVARRDLQSRVPGEPMIPDPVSEDTFKNYVDLYAYEPRDLNAEYLDEMVVDKYWDLERIRIDAAYRDESFEFHLYLPNRPQCSPPYQTVIYWPDAGGILAPRARDNFRMPLPFLPRACMAVAWPTYQGMFGRQIPPPEDLPEEAELSEEDRTLARDARILNQTAMEQVQDLSRVLDYLEIQPYIDSDSFAYFGYSWGGIMGPIPLAVDNRLKAAVFHLAGFQYNVRFAPPSNPASFVGHVEQPVLMLSGEFDSLLDLETRAIPFFEALGSEEKHHIKVPGGHSVSADIVIENTLAWFAEHL